MSTLEKLKDLMEEGFQEKSSLIKQRDMAALTEGLQKLDSSYKSKGYTIPPLDTIGMNLYGKFSCQIKNT